MIKLISISLLTVTLTLGSNSKIDVKVQPMVRTKKKVHEQGVFTINNKPFILIADSRDNFVRMNAVFYPIQDNMELGEPMRQEGVKIIDEYLTAPKNIYIENIITNNGQTYLFYSKRNEKGVTVSYVTLEEDCIIDENAATEVMDLERSTFSKFTSFDVIQSPDKSKILIVGMNVNANNTAEYIFKLYNQKMGQLQFEKTIKTYKTKGAFKGSDNFNGGVDPNSANNRHFLVNNEGRIYFLVDKENNSGIKHKLKFLSLESSTGEVSEKEFDIPGEYYVRTDFRLNKKGEACYFVFYSTESLPKIEVTNLWGARVTSLFVIAYDGIQSKVLSDIQFSDEQLSQFYPMSKRKSKTEYRIGGYVISNTLDLPNGDLAIVMQQSFSTVGTERPASNQGNGYVNVLILDSGLQFKSCHPYVSFAFSAKYNEPHRGKIYIRDGKLELLYINEKHELQLINLSDKNSKPINFGSKYSEKCYPLLRVSMLNDGNYIIPIKNTKKIGCSSLQ